MTFNRPMVSVIMLTYNHEKYIKKAVDSVLMQKVNFDYEIIISDDASTDRTREILVTNYFGVENIKLIFRNSNIGATKNSYETLKCARGKYLASCEGDDYWTDINKLQKQIDFLEQNKEYSGCTHLFTVVDDDDREYSNQYLSWIREKEIFTLDDFQGMFLPGQPSTFVRRNYIFDNRMDLSHVYKVHPYVGDKTLMLLFLLKGNFALLKENMSCYRKSYLNENTITSMISKNKAKFLEEDYEIVKRLENIASNNQEVDFTEGKKIIFAKALFWGICSFSKSSIKLAVRIFVENKDSSFLLYALYYYACRLKGRLF